MKTKLDAGKDAIPNTFILMLFLGGLLILLIGTVIIEFLSKPFKKKKKKNG